MKIKVHLITQIYIVICLLSGYFYEISTMYFCLFIHELGHFTMIKILKKKITLLEISPLGGILHLDKCQNDMNSKELLIYLSGPFASMLLYLYLSNFSTNEILINSSFYVLILNLLPILPLDGAKILMSLKQYILPYRWVLKIITILSSVVCFFLIYYFIYNYNYVIILLFFLYLNLLNYHNIPYQYYDFLSYKFFHPNDQLKEKIIVASKNYYSLFYKGFKNVFFINKIFYSEHDVLKQYLDKKQ